MNMETLEPPEGRARRDGEDRQHNRRKQALTANPDVSSPESGTTSEEKTTGSGGP